MRQVGFPIELPIKESVPKVLQGPIEQETKAEHSGSSVGVVPCTLLVLFSLLLLVLVCIRIREGSRRERLAKANSRRPRRFSFAERSVEKPDSPLGSATTTTSPTTSSPSCVGLEISNFLAFTLDISSAGAGEAPPSPERWLALYLISTVCTMVSLRREKAPQVAAEDRTALAREDPPPPDSIDGALDEDDEAEVVLTLLPLDRPPGLYNQSFLTRALTWGGPPPGTMSLLCWFPQNWKEDRRGLVCQSQSELVSPTARIGHHRRWCGSAEGDQLSDTKIGMLFSVPNQAQSGFHSHVRMESFPLALASVWLKHFFTEPGRTAHTHTHTHKRTPRAARDSRLSCRVSPYLVGTPPANPMDAPSNRGRRGECAS